MEPLKIAIFSGNIPSTTFIEHLIKGVALKHMVYVFGVQEEQVKYDSKNIKLFITPKSHLGKLVYNLYRTAILVLRDPIALSNLLKKTKTISTVYGKWIWFSKWLPILLYRPDLLHIQWARDVEHYMWLQEQFDIKICLSLRGAHINYTPIVEPRMAEVYRQQFPKIKAFHAVSKAMAMEAQKYGANLNEITVIHSPIPNFFLEAFGGYKKQTNIINLVSVGRFHWIKNYGMAIQAITILKEMGYKVSYTIVGEECFNEPILFQLHQLGLQNEIHLQPKQTQEQLIKLLKTQDIMLLPSLKEGIANVVLEAMALGLPVVSTNCGGMGEVIKHNETGWLVPVRDFEAMAKAVVDIINLSEDEINQITNNAHQLIQREFCMEDSIQKFIDWYESVI